MCPDTIRRGSRSLLLTALAAALASCGGNTPDAATARSEGVYGSYFYVTVVKPTGGTIVSGDGRINCGVGGSACGDSLGQTKYLWSEAPVTLSAVPDVAHGYVFQGWAGDCSGTVPSCTLTAGADRFVVAAFKKTVVTPPPTYGVSFAVNVSRPANGMVTSGDGKISCGTAGTACTASFPWASTVTLTATPDAGYVFQTWGGSCNLTGPCVLDTRTSGADKTVAAVFALAGQAGHGFFASQKDHGPAFLDFVGNVPGSLNCASASCHGPDLNGRGIAPSCNTCHARAGWVGSWQANCSFCHGSRNATTQGGPYDVAAHPTYAAPPDAVSQRLSGVAAPDRTGAHQAHLSGATALGLSFAQPFACGTCHAVPTDLTHIDGSSARAIVSLEGSGQASLPASLGSYDPAAGTCATYCHGSNASPRWSTTGLQCGACHDLPPAPSTGHPVVSGGLPACSGCHPGTVKPDGTLDVAGGKHLNGVVDVSGGHGDYTSPAIHGPAFFNFVAGAPGALTCTGCHGADFGGSSLAPSCNACHAAAGWVGSWQSNCSFCHGSRNATTQGGPYDVAAHPTWAAPPDAISQRLTGTPATDRTGAHQAHLSGATSLGLSFATPFECATCHAVPADLGHIDGSSARAIVSLEGAGQASLPASLGSYDPGTGTCAAYCHGSKPSPAWSTTGLQCGSCHDLPPAPTTGHPSVASDPTVCNLCHSGTVKPDGTLDVAAGKHLNGVVDVTGGHGDYSSPAVHGPAYFDFVAAAPGALDCTACHGADYNGAFGPSCNACHAAAGWSGGWQGNCSFCHGSRNATTQGGPYDVAAHPTWAAPPDAISQRLTGVTAPDRTGAHQAHLAGATSQGLSFALPFQCATCHAVPSDLTHIDGSSARAIVALSGAGQASLPPSLGSYSQASGTCATYCHGANPSPAWRLTGLQCGSCHDLPPAPGTGHPVVSSALTGCAICHPATVKADGTLDVAGGKHVNGTVEIGGVHGTYTSPAIHGPAFFDFLAGAPGALQCTVCHGADYGGGFGPSCNACHASAGWVGSWQSNCSFCHGSKNSTTQGGPYDVGAHPTYAAPPDAISQRLTGAAAPDRTGAHQAHLTGISGQGVGFAQPFRCETCHAVPSDLGHIDGSTARAIVTLSGANQGGLPASLGSYSQPAGTCATYCHGAGASPAWSFTGIQCGACHALPPAPSTGHPSVPSSLGICWECHPDTVNSDGTINVAGGKHVNGVIDAGGQHGDFTSPAVHGPKFFDFLAGATGALDCKLCHGADYGGGYGPSCNACHASAGWVGSWQANCSFCHGARNSTTQGGPYDVSAHPTFAAPPDAISQRLTGAAAPTRTGAHQAHLTGATGQGLSFALPFQCQTCHAVPADLGHIGGSASRATVALAGSGQASLPANLGSYTQAAGTCSTYCHGANASPAWSFTGLQCGSCHDLPPASTTGHPTVTGGLTACSGCHPGTVNADGTLNVAGGKHINGVVDAQGAHGDFTSPAVHGPMFFDFLAGATGSLACTSCHGTDFNGGMGPSCNACHAAAGWVGSWQSNCSFCHGLRNATTKAGPYPVASHPTWAAPPDAVSQRLTGAAAPARTGAHQVHLTGIAGTGSTMSAPFACGVCHAVPADLSHIGGSSSRATVTLAGTGSLPANLGTYNPSTGTCATYCHGQGLDPSFNPAAPAWQGATPSCATGCHTLPPATGVLDPDTDVPAHLVHTQFGIPCGACHANTTPATGPPALLPNPTAHVNGVKDIRLSNGGTWDPGQKTCNSACHGPIPWQ